LPRKVKVCMVCENEIPGSRYQASRVWNSSCYFLCDEIQGGLFDVYLKADTMCLGLQAAK
jgi:hypothetical protein